MGGERMPPYLRDKAKAVQRAEADLRGLALAADYSEIMARTLAYASARAMAEMTLARVAIDRQVLEVLTPEQRKQALEVKPEREAARGDGPRGGEGGGRR